MFCKSRNGLAPDYLKSMFTDRRAISTYSLRNCESKLPVPLAAKQQFFHKKTVSAIVVRCRGTSYLPICGRYKLLLVLNLAAGISFLIMNKLINHTAFMESRHFLIVIVFVVIGFN